MSKQIKAIIFDADGVVIRPTTLFSQQLIEAHHCNQDAVKNFFETDFMQCILGKANLKETLKQHISKFGWQGSVDSLLKEWFTSEDKPNQPLIKAIKELKRKSIGCYLATNQEKYRAQYLADEMKMLHLFDYIFFSYEMKLKKPQPKFWQYVWDSLSYMEGLNHKDEVMFWDDKEKNVLAAKRFGFDAYQFESNKHFKDTLEKYEIII